MKYMGSKRRIAKHILPIMINDADNHGITTWVEPFVGGGNSIDKVPDRFNRLGFDNNPHIIAALTAIRDFPEKLPDEVTEEEYRAMLKTPPDPITSWVRYVCSFGGKFENGYARPGKRVMRGYAREGKNSALKQSPLLKNVHLETADYLTLAFKNCLIYSDPPYKGTTKYKGQSFDYEAFYNWCRTMKELGNIVYVSEYNMPDDFKCVWQGEVKTNFASQRTGPTHNAVEKLFKL